MENLRTSFSAINMFIRCPFQYYCRDIRGIKIPPNIAMLFGNSNHKALGFNYVSKARTGIDEKASVIKDVFIEDWKMSLRGDFIKDEDDNPVEYEKKGITLLDYYMEKVAPPIMPGKDAEGALVEKEFNIKITENIEAKAYVDLIEANTTIRDHKTSSRSPDANALQKDMQLPFYGWIYKQKYGIMPKDLVYDYIVPLKKETKYVPVNVPCTELSLNRTLNIMRDTSLQIQNCMRSGLFPPNPTNWSCSFNQCGYWKMCHAKY